MARVYPQASLEVARAAGFSLPGYFSIEVWHERPVDRARRRIRSRADPARAPTFARQVPLIHSEPQTVPKAGHDETVASRSTHGRNSPARFRALRRAWTRARLCRTGLAARGGRNSGPPPGR